MFTSIDKAIAALIGAAVSIGVMLGLDVPPLFKDPAMVATVASVIAGALTWAVPNKT